MEGSKAGMGIGSIAMMAVYVLLSAGGLVIFKLGSQRGLSFGFSGGEISAKLNVLVIVGLLCYMFSFLLYMVLVSKFDLSYLMPLSTGTVYILTLIASILVFKESLSVPHMIGAGLILAGVVLINIKK